MRQSMSRREFVQAGAVSPLVAGMTATSSREAAAGDQARGDQALLRMQASYYQQFDADFTRDVPAEGYGGWKRTELEISRPHTAVVVMHAWDCGRREDYPGWYRAVEYIPRANAICETVFPRLLGALREHQFRLFHVIGGGEYYKKHPGYKLARDLAGPTSPGLETIKVDPSLERLRQFRSENVFVGKGNVHDVSCGSRRIDFAPQAAPHDGEGVAEDAHQLFALCKHFGINHLVYCGFAINWCILMSPGGMLDMSRRGIMCSALKQAVTAVENKETARRELNKEIALWRVSLAFGFVFDVDDFVAALDRPVPSAGTGKSLGSRPGKGISDREGHGS